MTGFFFCTYHLFICWLLWRCHGQGCRFHVHLPVQAIQNGLCMISLYLCPVMDLWVTMDPHLSDGECWLDHSHFNRYYCQLHLTVPVDPHPNAVRGSPWPLELEFSFPDRDTWAEQVRSRQMTSAPEKRFVCLSSLRAFWRSRCAKQFLWYISGFFHAELTPTAFVSTGHTMAALQLSHQCDDKEDKDKHSETLDIDEKPWRWLFQRQAFNSVKIRHLAELKVVSQQLYFNSRGTLQWEQNQI